MTEKPTESIDPLFGDLKPKGQRVVGLFHGILTGKTDETWPEVWECLLLLLDPSARAVLSWYYGLPFARLEALRNKKRLPALVRRMVSKCEFVSRRGGWAEIYLFGHSNGGVLVLLVARALIARGYKIKGLFLMAPALRSKSATAEIAKWIDEGSLEKATLLMATQDKTLGAVARFKLAVWPWGALGVEGWHMDAMYSLKAQSRMETVQMPVGHSTPLAAGNREATFKTLGAPFMGLDSATEVVA